MYRLFGVLIALYFLLGGGAVEAASTPFELRAAIEAARPGEVVRVPAGIYRGNFVIDKPLTLEGVGWPVIDGGNQGNVIEVNQAPDVTIRGMVIRNSGARLDKENAGIAVDRSPRAVLENNRLENTLFGIYIKDSEASRVAHNVIGAKDLDLPARGDGIRVWYSAKTEVIGNRVDRGRDVVLWYNNGAVVRDNIITRGRYGLHFMYCDDNQVENNRLENNSVGAFLMYSRRLSLRGNIFANNRGPSGYGIGLKDLDGVEADGNLITGNRVGMYFDNSPWSIDVNQHFRQNLFAYNDIGLLFTPSVKRNSFSQNSFIDNLEQVSLTGTGTFSGNAFTVAGEGNFWSDYAGYDADGDGLGDLPYVSQSLFENMMNHYPELRLFQLSPAQQAIDLAARAFPIFRPAPKFTDHAPLLVPVLPAVSLPPAAPAWPLVTLAAGLLALAAAVVGAGLHRGESEQPVRPATKKEIQPMFLDKILPLTAFFSALNRRQLSPAPGFSSHRLTSPAGANAPMISISHLTKTYGNFTAVDDLNLEVQAGEAVALWGPNGAGKTTIIRSLLGLLSTRGQVCVNGFDVRSHGKQVRAAIGYVPQELAFYEDMTAIDTLRFYAALKQAPTGRVDEALAEVGLTEHAAKAVAALSGGMKQRLALAIALLASPPLLILDEPTSNLDSRARDDFMKLLWQQKAQGRTLLFSSHRLEEVEALADRVMVLENGRLSLSCGPAELVQQLGLQLTLKLMVPERLRDNALEVLRAQGFSAAKNGVGLLVAVSPSAKAAPLSALLDKNIEVNNFDLESV